MTTPEGRKAMTGDQGSFQASRGSSECRKPVNLLQRDEKIDAWYRLQLTDTWCIGAKNIKGSNPDCNEVFVGRAPFQACHFWCHLRNENTNTANTNTNATNTNTSNTNGAPPVHRAHQGQICRRAMRVSRVAKDFPHLDTGQQDRPLTLPSLPTLNRLRREGCHLTLHTSNMARERKGG